MGIIGKTDAYVRHARGDRLYDLVRLGSGHRKRNARIFVTEPAQHFRQYAERHGIQRLDVQVAGPKIADVINDRLDPIKIVERLATVLQHDLACRCDLHALG